MSNETVPTEFTKVVNPGMVKIGRYLYPVFCKITYADGRLSITGVEGPKRNGDAAGGCGQIVGSLRQLEALSPGWDTGTVRQFRDAWVAWHLNDMRAGCEHQRAEKWNERPIDPLKPLNTYGKHFAGQRHDSWNMLSWVTREEHPEGLLSFPCPTCGYKYGTRWLHEDVPPAVIQFLAALPDSEVKPAWV